LPPPLVAQSLTVLLPVAALAATTGQAMTIIAWRRDRHWDDGLLMADVLGPVQDARCARAARRRASPVLDGAPVRRRWPGAGSPQATARRTSRSKPVRWS